MDPIDSEKSWMTAVTFAEAGEWETARYYAPHPRKSRLLAWIERHLEAAAFAEEGLHDEAMRIAGLKRAEEDALDALLRVHGMRIFCGVLSPAVLAPRR